MEVFLKLDIADGCSDLGPSQYGMREALDRKRTLDSLQERSPGRSYTRHLDDVSPDRKVSRYAGDEFSRPANRYSERPDPSWQSQDTVRRNGNGRDLPDTGRTVRSYADHDDRNTHVRSYTDLAPKESTESLTDSGHCIF